MHGAAGGRRLSTPWEQLISSTMTPTTAVAVKLAVTDEPDPSEPNGTIPGETGQRTGGGFLSSIRKRLPIFSSLSLNKNGQTNFSYRQPRFSSRRQYRRVVFKQGDCNVVQGKVAKRRRKYLQDIFTTLVDAQWRWTLLVFSMNFMLSWLGFAAVWWLIALNHGDLDVAMKTNNSNWEPCVREMYSFTACFLFSVETQHTIGYGSKHTTEECPEAIFVMCLQSIVGVMIQAFMVGVVFAKLSRPKKRTQTLLFSRNAVICQRDGILCLMFRVGDMRKSHIIEAHVRAQLIKKKVTLEGELLPFHQYELKVGGDGVEDRIFFIWPTTIVHKITPDSPLYMLSAADFLREKFEIVVVLEGVIESTGMTTQARSSYLPNEILWGHRFETLVSYKKETGEHEVNYSLFNNTYVVDTPLCSAHDLKKLVSIGTHTEMHHMHHLDHTTNIGDSLEGTTSRPKSQKLQEDQKPPSTDLMMAQLEPFLIKPGELPGPESFL
ncbi:G protein-activated inward rectifier potassium channel 3-like isoform X2 [Daktulosphaira vitifoliae]|uniref:G protein-activated inward rectifier potassium channel 3-like isoform X2 n=1 Tax=Daktulosphaira vitifoliae TaxID=58002 RepID=UPI0021A984AE|nr:G protein-activated inward rectifier potassium channel 3-like isoform X2 [Daktulosphaira vitifoliae]